MNETWVEIKAWRGQQRERLVALRVALSATVRGEWSAAINAHLRSGFTFPVDTVVGFCWPFKNEFDARFVIRDWRADGAIAALPAVVAKASPLQFRKWWPGAPMTTGVYDIPVPDGTALLVPDAAIVPMNGFDERCYRLGYGGGYFDRTLADQAPRAIAIGVAFECARLPTIYSQPHDIAMDFVVTEAGIYIAADAELKKIDADVCRARLRQLMATRGLPRRRAAAPDCYSSPPCYAGEFPGYFGDSGEAKE